MGGAVGRVSFGGDASLNNQPSGARVDTPSIATGATFDFVAWLPSNNTLGRIGFWVLVNGDAGAWTEWDNISLKEVPENAYRYYLETDGVDDWMNVLPVLNLGETWTHVGGWLRTGGSRIFALSTSAFSPVFLGDNNAQVYSEANLGASINTGSTSVAHVLTVERVSESVLTGRYNGISGTPVDPHAASSSTALALFSAVTNTFVSGLAGRFYGGLFTNSLLDEVQDTVVYERIKKLTGVV